MDLSTAKWHKASRSGDNGANCVEVAGTLSAVALRDSKDPKGGNILMSPADFGRLIKTLKDL